MRIYGPSGSMAMRDLFALRNEITTRIAVALKQELIAAEAARPTDRPDVLEHILRAHAAYAKPVSRDRMLRASGCWGGHRRSTRIPPKRKA